MLMRRTPRNGGLPTVEFLEFYLKLGKFSPAGCAFVQEMRTDASLHRVAHRAAANGSTGISRSKSSSRKSSRSRSGARSGSVRSLARS